MMVSDLRDPMPSKKPPKADGNDREPQLFEATLGINGAVKKGKAITQAEAMARRKVGGDVVVCGPNKAVNRQLAGIRSKMPAALRKLSKLCLHDAEVLGFGQYAQPDIWILSLKNRSEVTELIYSLWDNVRKASVRPAWPFSQGRKHWLYDELDLP